MLRACLAVTLCIHASAWRIQFGPSTLGTGRHKNTPLPRPLTDFNRGVSAPKWPHPSDDGAKAGHPPTEGAEVDASAEGYDLWWSCDPTEVAAPLRLDVHGELPAWLKGSIVRVGPGQFQVGRQRLQHQFDGLAKLTKYTINNGGVTFQARMLRSDLFNRTKLAAPLSSRRWAPHWTEPALMTMLAVQPTYTPCQRVRALIEEPATDNTNIFIWRTGRTCHACSDSSIASNAFDLHTLESRGHTRVELEAPLRMPDQTMTGAHRQYTLNGTDTVGWTGSLDLDPTLVQPAATVISVYRDTPVLPTETEADDEGDAEPPLTARRRYIGRVRIPLADHGMPMIHSFQVTRRYVILVVGSLRVEPHLIGSKLFVLQEPFAGLQTLGWRGTQNTTVYVIDIESTDPTTGPLRTFSIDPMYMNHHINAWEGEGGREVTMDVIAYRDGSFLSNPRGFGNLEVMRSSEERATLKALSPTIRRYTLDLQLPAEPQASAAHAPDAAGDSRCGPLWASWMPFELSPDRNLPTPADEWPAAPEGSPAADVLHMEMPRFNDLRHGLPYRYVWGVGSPDSTPTHVSGVVKVDLGDPRGAPWGGPDVAVDAPCLSWYRKSHYPSEPIFVPRPGATEEDDGVVLSVILDGKRGKSYLLVLNATTMQTMATAYSPVVMPADFHGEWFPHEEEPM